MCPLVSDFYCFIYTTKEFTQIKNTIALSSTHCEHPQLLHVATLLKSALRHVTAEDV